MIHIHLNLVNPWSRRWRAVWSCGGGTPFANKFWELELVQSNHIVGAGVVISTRVDHAGLQLTLALLGYWLNFNFRDRRHFGE